MITKHIITCIIACFAMHCYAAQPKRPALTPAQKAARLERLRELKKKQATGAKTPRPKSAQPKKKPAPKKPAAAAKPRPAPTPRPESAQQKKPAPKTPAPKKPATLPLDQQLTKALANPKQLQALLTEHRAAITPVMIERLLSDAMQNNYEQSTQILLEFQAPAKPTATPASPQPPAKQPLAKPKELTKDQKIAALQKEFESLDKDDPNTPSKMEQIIHDMQELTGITDKILEYEFIRLGLYWGDYEQNISKDINALKSLDDVEDIRKQIAHLKKPFPDNAEKLTRALDQKIADLEFEERHNIAQRENEISQLQHDFLGLSIQVETALLAFTMGIEQKEAQVLLKKAQQFLKQMQELLTRLDSLKADTKKQAADLEKLRNKIALLGLTNEFDFFYETMMDKQQISESDEKMLRNIIANIEKYDASKAQELKDRIENAKAQLASASSQAYVKTPAKRYTQQELFDMWKQATDFEDEGLTEPATINDIKPNSPEENAFRMFSMEQINLDVL